MVERLNPKQVEAFRAVMLSGTVTAAGELLHLSQPSVSRLIADFELDSGLILFERRGRQLVPTETAHLLMREVERHRAADLHLLDTMRALREFRTGRLQIIAMPTLAMHYLAGVLRRFLDARPGVSVVIRMGSSEEICRVMAAQQAELGLGTSLGPLTGVIEEPMPTVSAVCVCPANHPLARRRVIRPADLHGVDFILPGGSSPLRQALEAMFAANGIRPRIRLETLFTVTAMAYVAQGLGVAIVDPYAAGAAPSGTRVRPVAPSLPFGFSALFPAFLPRSGLAHEFAALLARSIPKDFRLQEAAPGGNASTRRARPSGPG